MRTNAPKIITVVAGIVLTVVGLSASGVYSIGFVNDLLASAGIALTRDQAYFALVGSPLLLMAGSLLAGL